jgi:hypothetical protein
MKSGSRRRTNMTNDAAQKPEEQAGRPERSDVQSEGVMLVPQQTVVLLIYLVGSVLLMREYEASTIHRWTDFVRTVTASPPRLSSQEP